MRQWRGRTGSGLYRCVCGFLCEDSPSPLDDLDLFTHHYRPGLGSLLRNLPQAPEAMLFIPLTLDLLLTLHSHVIVITVSRTHLFHLVSPTPEMHTLFTFAS